MQEKNRNEESSESRWKSQSGRSNSGAATAAVEESGHVLEGIKESGAHVAERAKEMASNLKDRAQEYGEIAIDETSSMIKKYPAQSLLIGFGAGLAVGLLVARR